MRLSVSKPVYFWIALLENIEFGGISVAKHHYGN